MRLESAGYIKLTGGCEVHGELNITMRPECGEILFHVKNNLYLYDESKPVNNFTFRLPEDDVARFLRELKELLDHTACHNENGGTYDKSLEVYLPMEGHLFEATFHEYTMEESLDDAMTCITQLVLSNNPVALNATSEFLGQGEELGKVVINISDAHMMYGGHTIRLNLDGKAEVQLLYLDNTSGNMNEIRYSLSLGRSDINTIVKTLVNSDLVTIELDDRPGLPDELRISLDVTNSAGESCNLSTWAGSTPGPGQYPGSPRERFDTSFRVVKNIVVAECDKIEPEYNGPLKAG